MATLWRVFPWQQNAHAGARFSPQYLPPQSGQGRFDLPRPADGSAWYFAETPEHALAEKLLDLRNRSVADEFLFEHGHRLALCAVELERALVIADLCSPRELSERGIVPDRLANRDRAVTQAISESLYQDSSLAGFRWWSSITGEWHTVILFSNRLEENALSFATPRPLTLTSDSLARAASALAIELDPRHSPG